MFAFIAAALRSLKNALLWTGSAAFELVAWPFRLFAGPQGRRAVPALQPSDDKRAAMAQDTKKFAAEVLAASQPGQPTAGLTALLDAKKSVDWARVVVASAGKTTPPLPQIGLKAAWLGNLSRKELVILGHSRASDVAAHMCGRACIEGLPRPSEILSSNPLTALRKPLSTDVSGDAEFSAAGPGNRRRAARSRRSHDEVILSSEPASALSA